MPKAVSCLMENELPSKITSDFRELISIFKYEVQQAQRPADQVILTAEDVMCLLKISKRKLCYLMAERQIPYHTIDSGSRKYFLLSDLLNTMKENRVEAIDLTRLGKFDRLTKERKNGNSRSADPGMS